MNTMAPFSALGVMEKDFLPVATLMKSANTIMLRVMTTTKVSPAAFASPVQPAQRYPLAGTAMTFTVSPAE